MEWFWDKFRGSDKDDYLNTFNLMLFDSKKKLPKTIIITAGFDPLCDDGEKYAYLLHKKGDKVKKGQTLCIIEAMKIMNEIESEYDGHIIDVLVNNSEPVEYNAGEENINSKLAEKLLKIDGVDKILFNKNGSKIFKNFIKFCILDITHHLRGATEFSLGQ